MIPLLRAACRQHSPEAEEALESLLVQVRAAVVDLETALDVAQKQCRHRAWCLSMAIESERLDCGPCEEMR